MSELFVCEGGYLQLNLRGVLGSTLFICCPVKGRRCVYVLCRVAQEVLQLDLIKNNFKR